MLCCARISCCVDFRYPISSRLMMKKLAVCAIVFLFLASSLFCATKQNQVTATIAVGLNPQGIAITYDSRFAYVANNNGNSVSVLDLTTNTVVQTITDVSFNQPYTITINPAGTKAYVTNSNGETVTIIDLTTNLVTGTISGFDGPSGCVITPDGNYAYVNNYGGAIVQSGYGVTVSVVDLNTPAIVATVALGPPAPPYVAPAALAITPDGAYVYVVNYVTGDTGTGTISIIRTSNNTAQLNAITGFSGPFAIAITPDGQYAYITNFGSNNFAPIGTTVSVVSLSSNTIVATIPLGIQPAGVAITPYSSYAYVSNYNTLYEEPDFGDLTAGEGTVNIINTKTNKVVSPTIQVDLSPGAVAISPNGRFAYVSNYTSNTVSVIPLLGLYDLNRLQPLYYQQLNETITTSEQAGL